MKKTKEQPSLAGLLLIVTGMLLISIVMLFLTGSGTTGSSAGVLTGLGVAGIASLAAGAFLSAGGKRK